MTIDERIASLIQLKRGQSADYRNACVEAVPELVAEIRRLRGEVARLTPLCDNCRLPKPLVVSSVSNGELCADCSKLLEDGAAHLKEGRGK